jgi:hypothetical protein
MEDSAGAYRSLDDIVDDRITLREVIFESRNLIRRRYDPIQRKNTWDYGIEPTKICSDFIQEVFAKLGLI